MGAECRLKQLQSSSHEACQKSRKPKLTAKESQQEIIETADGFISALDQSGGSTPGALKLFGIDSTEYSTESEMFDKVHEMRSRIMMDPKYNGRRVIGAILFENTMDREVQGMPTAEYLWKKKGVVPFFED